MVQTYNVQGTVLDKRRTHIYRSDGRTLVFTKLCVIVIRVSILHTNVQQGIEVGTHTRKYFKVFIVGELTCQHIPNICLNMSNAEVRT